MFDDLHGTPAAIVGEVEAGQGAKVLKQIKALVKGLITNTFDLAELLHEVKSKQFYAPKYNTFGEYAKTLDIKTTKAYYLVRIVENMKVAGLAREVYEPIGITKLRVIGRLPSTGEYQPSDGGPAVPMPEVIKKIVEGASDKTVEDIKNEVAIIQGLTGDDAIGWVNFAMKNSAREIWRKAIDLAKKNIGSVGKDEDGNSKDASDGAAAEVIAVDFLNDPNNFYDTDLLKEDDNAAA